MQSREMQVLTFLSPKLRTTFYPLLFVELYIQSLSYIIRAAKEIVKKNVFVLELKTYVQKHHQFLHLYILKRLQLVIGVKMPH